MTTTTLPTGRAIADRLIKLCQHSTAEELLSHLELMTHLYGYIEKALKHRFPAEYHAYLAAHGEIEEEEE